MEARHQEDYSNNESKSPRSAEQHNLTLPPTQCIFQKPKRDSFLREWPTRIRGMEERNPQGIFSFRAPQISSDRAGCSGSPGSGLLDHSGGDPVPSELHPHAPAAPVFLVLCTRGPRPRFTAWVNSSTRVLQRPGFVLVPTPSFL